MTSFHIETNLHKSCWFLIVYFFFFKLIDLDGIELGFVIINITSLQRFWHAPPTPNMFLSTNNVVSNTWYQHSHSRLGPFSYPYNWPTSNNSIECSKILEFPRLKQCSISLGVLNIFTCRYDECARNSSMITKCKEISNLYRLIDKRVLGKVVTTDSHWY